MVVAEFQAWVGAAASSNWVVEVVDALTPVLAEFSGHQMMGYSPRKSFLAHAYWRFDHRRVIRDVPFAYDQWSLWKCD